MKYKDYNDSELLSYIREENEEANEIIYEKYKPMIIMIAKKMVTKCNSIGLEVSDLVQEGMIALAEAIRTYNDIKDVTFYTYVKVCIERRMIGLIRKSGNLRNKCLNNAVPYDIGEPYSIEETVSDIINPENSMISLENKKELLSKANEILTKLEYDVFKLKIEGLNYKEIAKVLNKDAKNIDNALTRIKNKLR
ncbi:MAG: sigma-70 family RNA polymerase sigma factor [Bacilli bacterium]|nr:sigma-70 family RNA polymerase sigma factor [Bacilli bacterium]